jgi:hypothetical protein
MSVEHVHNPGVKAAAEGAVAADGSSNSCHNASSASAELASEVLTQLAAMLPRIVEQQGRSPK